MKKESKYSFEEHARSLTGADIVDLFLRSILQYENVGICLDVDTFGEVKKGKLIACPATVSASLLSGVKFTKANIKFAYSRADAVGSDHSFYLGYQYAMDYLRQARIVDYNRMADVIGLAGLEEMTDYFLAATYNSNLDNSYHLNRIRRFRQVQLEPKGDRKK